MASPLTTGLRAELKARGCPYELRYGPQRLTLGPRAKSHIELSRDRAAGDGFGAGKSRPRNPVRLYTRSIGYLCRVFAEATGDGADQEAHEQLADRIVDTFMASLDAVVRGQLRSGWDYRSGKLLTAAELAEPQLQKWPGVIYAFAFEVDRSVLDAGYDQQEALEAPVGGPGGITIEQGTITVTGGTGAATALPGAKTEVRE